MTWTAGPGLSLGLDDYSMVPTKEQSTNYDQNQVQGGVSQLQGYTGQQQGGLADILMQGIVALNPQLFATGQNPSAPKAPTAPGSAWQKAGTFNGIPKYTTVSNGHTYTFLPGREKNADGSQSGTYIKDGVDVSATGYPADGVPAFSMQQVQGTEENKQAQLQYQQQVAQYQQQQQQYQQQLSQAPAANSGMGMINLGNQLINQSTYTPMGGYQQSSQTQNNQSAPQAAQIPSGPVPIQNSVIKGQLASGKITAEQAQDMQLQAFAQGADGATPAQRAQGLQVQVQRMQQSVQSGGLPPDQLAAAQARLQATQQQFQQVQASMSSGQNSGQQQYQQGNPQSSQSSGQNYTGSNNYGLQQLPGFTPIAPSKNQDLALNQGNNPGQLNLDAMQYGNVDTSQYSPFMKNGQQASDQLASLSGLGANPMNSQQIYDQYLNNPAVQAQMQQGNQAINNSYSAKGMLGSGGLLKALNSYGQGVAAQTLGAEKSNLFNQSQLGADASNQYTGSLLNKYGTDMGAQASNQANQVAGYKAQGDYSNNMQQNQIGAYTAEQNALNQARSNQTSLFGQQAGLFNAMSNNNSTYAGLLSSLANGSGQLSAAAINQIGGLLSGHINSTQLTREPFAESGQGPAKLQ